MDLPTLPQTFPFVCDDGGRSRYFRGRAGDCVVRSIAIAMGRDYLEVYSELSALCKAERQSKCRTFKRVSARNGVDTKRKWFREYMRSHNYVWQSAGFGAHYSLNPRCFSATGTFILSMRRHYSCLKDGVLYDIVDPSREGTAPVFGYWYKPDHFATNMEG